MAVRDLSSGDTLMKILTVAAVFAAALAAAKDVYADSGLDALFKRDRKSVV